MRDVGITTSATIVRDGVRQPPSDEVVAGGPRGTSVLRVLLFDPQALVRQMLRSALEMRTGFRVVAETREREEAIESAALLRPDLALVHACIDIAELLQIIELIRDVAPDCRVILIGAEEDVEILISALDSGATGYFTKTSPFSELVDAAARATEGQFLLPRSMLEELLGRLLERRSQEIDALRAVARLTAREREVLWLLANGADNERIGRALLISPQTSRTHVQKILSKLRLHSRLEAVAFVRRLGHHAELLRPIV